MSAAAYESWFSTLSSARQNIFKAGMEGNQTVIQRQAWRIHNGKKWIRKKNGNDFCVWETRLVPEPSVTHGKTGLEHGDGFKSRIESSDIEVIPQSLLPLPNRVFSSQPTESLNPIPPAMDFGELLQDLTQKLHCFSPDTRGRGEHNLLLRELTVSLMNLPPYKNCVFTNG